MEFKQFLEMASFTLPHPVKIKDQIVAAVDMQFEKSPPTINQSGRVMNQGSNFIARIPNTSIYLAYDGAGHAKFISKDKIAEYLAAGFQQINDDWWEKAFFVEE
jgi:hypothetical protein